MLVGDTAAAATRSAGIFAAPELCQFYDPERRAGHAIAESLGHPGEVAWDSYLFYPKGARWDDMPPRPVEWMHQLGAPWADRTRYHWGHALIERLDTVMRKLTRPEV